MKRLSMNGYKTITAGTAGVLGATVPLILHAAGAVDLPKESIAPLVVEGATSLIFTVLRMFTNGPIGGSARRGARRGIAAMLLLTLMAIATACQGCGPGYSERIPDRVKTALSHASVNTLEATPKIIRLSNADKAWAEPAAATFEHWTETLLRSANAALTECVDPGPLVEEALAALEGTLDAWNHPTPAAYVQILRPIFEDAVADIWPYQVGHCPYLQENTDLEDVIDVEVTAVDVQVDDGDVRQVASATWP